MKKTLVSTITLIAALAAPAAVNQQRNITVDGTQRRYILYVPDGVTENAPLVVSLHGAAGHDTDRSPFRTTVADQAKCIVVYPQGENQNFGPFGTVPGWNSTGEPNTDSRFLRAILDDVASSYTIDRQRIYCCGFSNGGMMTYSNATTLPDLFAAYASISGFPLNEFHHRFTGSRPVPFLHIHGKADDFVKYSLMPVIRDNMVARNGCNPTPSVTSVTGKYRHSIYSPYTAGESFPYEYIEVDGMGHNDFTANTPDGNSALTMWRFFERFRLSDPCDTTLRWRCPLDQIDFDPATHGWTVNPDATRFTYGTNPQPNNADNNVYHSLQFNPGTYRLSARHSGDTPLYIRIETLDGTELFTKKCTPESDIEIPFSVPTFGLYRIIVLKTTPDTRISRLEIHSTPTLTQAQNCTDSQLPPENIDATLIEIPQSQGKEYDDFARTQIETFPDHTLYTATGDLQIAFKMMNIDVHNCDYLLIRFAEPLPAGWHVAFHEGTDLSAVPAGATEVKFDLTPTMRTEGRAPQICMMTFFGTPVPLRAKVTGVYKHSLTSSSLTAIPTDSSDTPWYDIRGIAHPTPPSPGLYIHNGKKIKI